MTGVVALTRRPLSAPSALGSALRRLEAQHVPTTVAVLADSVRGDAEPLDPEPLDPEPLDPGPRDVALPPVAATADLLVLRDVPPVTLRALVAGPVRCCNPAMATAWAADKSRTDQLLRLAEVPMPDSTTVADWAAVHVVAAGPVAVKPWTGRDGRGVLLARRPADLPAAAPYPGPYLVQQLVPGDGPDRKVYVIGTQVAGVLRPWPVRTRTDKHGQPYAPTPAERAAALGAGLALGLEVYGVDLRGDADRPVVVDVNPMPGFAGVPDADRHLADHFLAHVRAERRMPCGS